MKPVADTRLLLRLHAEPAIALASDGAWIPLERKDAAWLSVLALDGPTARDTLASWIWPDVSLKTANTSLRQRIFRLRRKLNHELVRAGASMSLLGDVAAFADPECLAGLDYADCLEFAAWLAEHRTRQRQRRLEALAQDVQRHEHVGELAKAISLAQELVTLEPLSEQRARWLMRLHHQRGDRAAAVAVYLHLEQRLDEALGLACGPETRELLDAVERVENLPARPRPQPLPAGLRRPPRMVGRDLQLAELDAAWAAGRVFVVLGEAGIGKTRLLEEFLKGQPPALLLSSRPGDEGVSYSLLTRLARALHDRDMLRCDALQRAALAQLAPELADTSTPMPRQGERQLLRAVLAAVSGAVDAGIGRLVFDDLHFADDASLQLLQNLLMEHRVDGLSLGLAQRPAEGSTRVQALQASLEDAGRLQPVVLQGLNRDELQALLADVIPESSRTADTADGLLGHCGGNPLFVLETLRQSSLDGHGGSGQLPGPSTIAALIGRRLQTISPTALALARVAAIAGADFDIGIAESVLQSPALALADAWSELESAQILVGTGFAHDLVHSAVERGVPDVIARHTHASIADILRHRGAPASTCARHWQAGAKHTEAALAWLAAADHAISMSDRAGQCHHLAEAAACWEAAGEAGAAHDAWCARLEPLIAVEGAEATFGAAEQLIARAPDEAHRLRALLGRGHALVWSARHDEAQETLTTVLDSSLIDQQTRWRATELRARSMALNGRAGEALDSMLSIEAQVQAQATDAYRLTYLSTFVACLTYAQRRVEAMKRAREAVDLARRAGRRDELEEALATASGVAMSIGDLDAAVEFGRVVQRMRQETGDESAARWVHDCSLALCLQSQALYAEALALLERACERLDVLLPDSAYMGIAAASLAGLMLELGRPEQALRLTAEPRAAWPALVRARCLVQHARAMRAIGKPSLRIIDQAIELAQVGAALPVQLAARLDRSLELDPGAALAACDEVLRLASAAGLASVACQARLRRVQALMRGGHTHDAAQAAMEVLVEIDRAGGVSVHRPEAWWIAACAAQGVGDVVRVGDLLACARRWLEQVALPQVPEAFRTSFVHRHPVHRALHAWFSQPEAPSFDPPIG